MLNLVQLQERLKDVPMQALMQYANGSNPQVPPFLALGELNRRKKMQEGAAAEQAKEMEGAPSIKDQIEQSAGLLALQGSRQRQAAQQQQGIQAAMPMAAPNTTTSEPAQMAGGGFVDDVVVPRDYQGGGQVGQQMNPEMLKKLMMLKAMKQRQGVGSIPVGNMFNRADFAGGGIVAFDNGGSVFNRIDTSDTMRKKAEQYRDFWKRLFGKRAGEDDVDPADPTAMLGTPVSPEASNLASVKDRDEAMRAEADRRQQLFMDLLSGKRKLPVPSTAAPTGIETVAPKEKLATAPTEGAPAKPGPGLPGLVEMSDEERLNKLRNLQRLAGVKENPFADIEARYKGIEAEDMRRRGEQPMDQLSAFLSGIAEGRGGNWATQGARGAKASSQLRAEQQALNRKQDLDMSALQMSLAKEADARARGDVDAVRKEKETQDKLKLDMAKLESEDLYRKGSIRVQEQRNLLDRTNADKTRQMAEINEYISNYRAKNANNTKYIGKPDLLEQDAMNAAIRFFGPDRFKNLGLAPGFGSAPAAPSGNRPPLSSFQK